MSFQPLFVIKISTTAPALCACAVPSAPLVEVTRLSPDTTPITVSSRDGVLVPAESTLSITATTPVSVGSPVDEASGMVVTDASATPPAPICPTHFLAPFLNLSVLAAAIVIPCLS